jgi:hypothetical protein
VSCAALPQPGAPAPSASGLGAVGGATVLAVRPIVPAVAAGDAGAWRALMLDGATDSASPAGTAALAEFIVRLDSGPTLSIVQPQAAGPRVGDRVDVAHSPSGTGRATLVRLL